MPEAERRFSMSRLEAFSDGVIAVIITIMVLELKAPETPEPAALVRLWPSFAIYLVSFVFVAIYWINHHNLLVHAGPLPLGSFGQTARSCSACRSSHSRPPNTPSNTFRNATR